MKITDKEMMDFLDENRPDLGRTPYCWEGLGGLRSAVRAAIRASRKRGEKK